MDKDIEAVLVDKEHSSQNKKSYKAVLPGLVDIVEYKNQPHYLLKSGQDLIVRKSHRAGDNIHYPPSIDQLPWKLPRYEEVLKEYSKFLELGVKTNEQLFDDVVEYHRNISDLPDSLYLLIAAWTIHTYRQEEFEYSPEMAFYAVPERGKSRTGKGMIYAAYRGVHIVSIREPFIFRMAELCSASLFFDISKFLDVVEKNGCTDLFLNRFEKGGKVPRVLNPERGDFKDTKYYQVFGPTVIATNTELDEVLDTRCVTVIMQDTEREFEDDVRPEHGLPMRERLVAYRAANMDTPLPDIPKPTKRRLGDIMRPLMQIIISMKPESHVKALEYISSLEKDAVYRRSETLAGKLVAVLLHLENEVFDGVLSLKRITEEMNDGTPEKYHYSPKRIGSMLTALGLREKATAHWKTSDGSAAIPWNAKQVKRLSVQYGVDNTLSQDSVSSVTPVHDLKTGQTGQTEEKMNVRTH
ncbi:MAG: hypothetical protein ABIH36_00190 [bacterium]